MKTTINYILLFFFLAFTSCSKSDDNGLPTEDGIGSSSDSFWPFAVGNTWQLVNSDNAQDKSDYIIHKTLTHEGKTYYQFKPIGTEVEIMINNGVREDNGIFYELHGSVANSGVNITPGTITSINTRLKVGEVWRDEVTLRVSGLATGTIKHLNEGKILEKSANVTINGKTYKDVLKAEIKKTVLNSITTIPVTIIYEIWLAKGVGIVFEKNTYDDNEVTSYGLATYALK